MPGAAERFARALSNLRAAEADTIEVSCGIGGGVPHRVRISGTVSIEACDHDVEAEWVVAAVGGEPPTCLRLVELAASATAPQLWTSVRASAVVGDEVAQDVLARLPAHVRCRMLAARLEDEFAGASDCVRETVAKLGLALLAPGYEPTAADVATFQMTRSLPRWDTGPRWWTDKELVLLQRLMRVAPGERLPHLDHWPSDRSARRLVAEYAATILDEHHLYTRTELGAALSPLFHNVTRLIRSMLDESTLQESSGCFRTGAQPRSRNRATSSRP